MIRSIRRFLFISLFISITVASSITAIGNYLLDKQIIKPYLDGELIKIHTVIEKLNQLSDMDFLTHNNIKHYLETNSFPYFMFQIWGENGKLYFHSENSTNINLSKVQNGFSDIYIKDKEWRVYAQIDSKKGTKIVVAEVYDIRNKLTDLITRNNGYILLVTFPLFAILVWIIVGMALRSLTRVTHEISDRASNYLEPVETGDLPIEIKPLVVELNHLFKRLKLAFDRNKRFASDAAHELHTPLAALKTQAQVALKAENDVDRADALMKVAQCVDRSSHVVTQLLTLSRINQETTLKDWSELDFYKLTKEILTYIAPSALEKNIDIELSDPPPKTIVYGNETALGILIRNIVDNAIRYTPKNGAVKVTILNQNNEIIFRVTDTGPGIPTELRERVFERFYRILGNKAAGSGLGLSIVSQIAELHHARINLSTPSNNLGLQFDVAFPTIKDLHHGNI